MDKKWAFVMGFVIGGFVGWVLGILSAPRSGKETWDNLSERAIELRDRAEEAANQVRDQVVKATEAAEEEMGEI